MQAEAVAVFLTSTLPLLNRMEKWAWRQAGIRPLRRSVPVSGINKTAKRRKHTVLVEWRVGRSSTKGCYMDENGLYLRLSSDWSVHLRYHLWHHTYCLCKTPALCKHCLWLSSTLTTLVYICLTDLCLSLRWRITWRVVGSLICIGSPFSWHNS